MRKIFFCLLTMIVFFATGPARAANDPPRALGVVHDKTTNKYAVETPSASLHPKNAGWLKDVPADTVLLIDDKVVATTACGKDQCFTFDAAATGPATRPLKVTLKDASGAVLIEESKTFTFSAEPAPAGAAESGQDRPPATTPSQRDAHLKQAYEAALQELTEKQRKKVESEVPKGATPHENIYVDPLFGEGIAILFYNGKGELLFAPIEVDEDDTIVVAILQDDRSVPSPRVTACGRAPAIRIGGSDIPATIDTFANNDTPASWIVKAHACSADTGLRIVGITTTTGNQTGTKAYEITVPTLSLNRLTVGLGLIYDLSVETEYRGATVKGENVPVIVRDQRVRGFVPPVAMVSLRPFKLDAQRTRLAHRLIPAPTVGFSVTDPLDHLYLGILVEPFPGLGAVAGYHFHREPTLGGGFKEGDRQPTGAIPTDERWGGGGHQDRNWFFGLNIDAALLVRLVGKVL